VFDVWRKEKYEVECEEINMKTINIKRNREIRQNENNK
jgi:hypothetical protein